MLSKKDFFLLIYVFYYHYFDLYSVWKTWVVIKGTVDTVFKGIDYPK